MAEPRTRKTVPMTADYARLIEHLFQEKSGQWYGEVAQYRLRSLFRPVYRRASETDLKLEGFMGAARMLSMGREYPLLDVLSKAAPDEKLKIERLHRVINGRNFVVSGGSHKRIYLSYFFMNRRGLAEYTEYISEVLLRMARFGVDPHQMVSEFSQKHGMDNDILLEFAEAQRSIGSSVALMDFGLRDHGSGLLDELRPEILGIDPALLQKAVERPDAALLLRSLVDAASARGINVLIEGIDTRRQFEIAMTTKATLFRGDLLGPLDPRLVRARAHIGTAEFTDKAA